MRRVRRVMVCSGLVVGLCGTGPAWAQPERSVNTTSAAVATQEAYDFGDFTSSTLTAKAWEAYDEADYAAVEAYTNKCIELYATQAQEQTASLSDFAPKDTVFSYWAMNDVATSYLILGQALHAQGRIREAGQAFNTILSAYPYAQAWDPKGWFWKVAEAANDKLKTIGTEYDFGDSTSATLTRKAWEALAKQDHRGVELFTTKCIELYAEEAKKQQASLSGFVDWERDGRDAAFRYWALNDVATCYFILGESLIAQGRHQEALEAFLSIISNFTFAQCWDPKGWFWKVATAARERVNKINILLVVDG